MGLQQRQVQHRTIRLKQDQQNLALKLSRQASRKEDQRSVIKQKQRLLVLYYLPLRLVYLHPSHQKLVHPTKDLDQHHYTEPKNLYRVCSAREKGQSRKPPLSLHRCPPATQTTATADVQTNRSK